jgi:arginyl-tRNA synthetase
MNSLIKFKNQIELLGFKVEIPPPEIEADLAIPCFKLNKNEIVQKIKDLREPLISDIEIVGDYINIVVNKNLLAQNLFQEVEKEKDGYGQAEVSANQKIIIEFSDPNIAKPLNVGHFRSTMIGQALVNLYRWQKYEVISINHLGDWGTQFGKLLVAHQKWNSDEPDLFKLYVRFHAESENNHQLEEEARQAFKKLENGDSELLALWQKITEESVVEFDKIYNELKVKFDHIIGESFYKDLAKEAISEALQKKVAEKSEGAVIISETKTGLPTFVIQKSDESSIYASRDLAAAKDRLERWQPEKIIYAVGSEQNLYFKQIFKTLGLLGYDPQKFVHVSLGLVILSEGKMSTRQGKVVLLEDLLKEALEKTKGDKVIAYGALIYNALSSSPEKTIIFDWQKMLSLNGASAPYIQYGYVRAKSILEKIPNQVILNSDRGRDEESLKSSSPSLRESDSERSNLNRLTNTDQNLIKLLALFPEICQQAQQLNAPHLLAAYLNNLVQEFNRFYATERVLEEKEESVKNFRLRLISAFIQVVKNGLGLLNINVPEKM